MLKRAMKYVIMTLAIFLAIKYIPVNKLEQRDAIMIAIIGAIVFALLDMYSPHIAI